jgi:ribosomal protein S18 acetylase RimI-like enzyme
LATGTLIRKAGAADVPALIEVLSAAFDTDPVMNWFIRQDGRRDAAFRRFFDLALTRLTLPHGEVYTTEDQRAAACWTPPGSCGASLSGQILLLAEYFRICGRDRFLKVTRAFAPLQMRHPHRPHFYLFFLGVLPACQGLGLGSALLRSMLERCDAEGIPAYLENSNQRNLPLYRRHGFEVRERFQLAPDGPPLWLMWRGPGGREGPARP